MSKHDDDCICEGRDSDIHDLPEVTPEYLGRLEVFADSLQEETERESSIWRIYRQDTGDELGSVRTTYSYDPAEGVQLVDAVSAYPEGYEKIVEDEVTIKINDEAIGIVADVLAYQQVKRNNPKADSDIWGYYAFSQDQRDFLIERQKENARDILEALKELGDE